MPHSSPPRVVLLGLHSLVASCSLQWSCLMLAAREGAHHACPAPPHDLHQALLHCGYGLCGGEASCTPATTTGPALQNNDIHSLAVKDSGGMLLATPPRTADYQMTIRFTRCTSKPRHGRCCPSSWHAPTCLGCRAAQTCELRSSPAAPGEDLRAIAPSDTRRRKRVRWRRRAWGCREAQRWRRLPATPPGFDSPHPQSKGRAE